MLVSSQETCPLPEHPVLAGMASGLHRIGEWATISDREYRLVYITDQSRLTFGGLLEMVPVPLGAYSMGTEYIDMFVGYPGKLWSIDTVREAFSAVGPGALADAPGGREELRERVDPRLHDILEGLSPDEDSTARPYLMSGSSMGASFDTPILALRIHDRSGQFVGIASLAMTAVGMATLGALTTIADLRHLERMMGVAKAGGARRRSSSPTLKAPRRWRDASPRRATSGSDGASRAQRTSAWSTREAWSVATSAMGSWRSSWPRQPVRNPPPRETA